MSQSWIRSQPKAAGEANTPGGWHTNDGVTFPLPDHIPAHALPPPVFVLQIFVLLTYCVGWRTGPRKWSLVVISQSGSPTRRTRLHSRANARCRCWETLAMPTCSTIKCGTEGRRTSEVSNDCWVALPTPREGSPSGSSHMQIITCLSMCYQVQGLGCRGCSGATIRRRMRDSLRPWQ